MSDKMKESIVAIDTLIESANLKMSEDLETCMESAKNLNCSSLNVWEH